MMSTILVTAASRNPDCSTTEQMQTISSDLASKTVLDGCYSPGVTGATSKHESSVTLGLSFMRSESGCDTTQTAHRVQERMFSGRSRHGALKTQIDHSHDA